jgi:hypothetical protein
MIYAARFGILGLASVYIPVQIIEIPAALYLANRVLHVSPLQVARAAAVPLLATVAMSAAVIIVEALLLGTVHASDLVTLVVCLALAAAMYLGSLLLLDRRIIAEARGVLLRGL